MIYHLCITVNIWQQHFLNATVVLRPKQAKQNERQTFPMVLKTLFFQKLKGCATQLCTLCLLLTYHLFIQF